MPNPLGKAKKRTPKPAGPPDCIAKLLADHADPLQRIREAAGHAEAILEDPHATQAQRSNARTLIEMSRAATQHREDGNCDQALRTAMEAQAALSRLHYNPWEGTDGLTLAVEPVRLRGVYIKPSRPQVSRLLVLLAERKSVPKAEAMQTIGTDSTNVLKQTTSTANRDIEAAGGTFRIKSRGGTIHIEKSQK